MVICEQGKDAGRWRNVSWRMGFETSVVYEHLNIITPIFSNIHRVIRHHL